MRSRRRPARSDAGATDPILVIAAIAVSLVLLVGGSFAVAAAVSSAKDTNARQDLDRIASAEQAAPAYFPVDAVSDDEPLGNSSIKAQLSDGGYAVALPCRDTSGPGWVAGSRSQTGAVFLRSSASSTTTKAPATPPLPSCASAGDVTDMVAQLRTSPGRNLLSNASFETGDRSPWGPNGDSTRFTTTITGDARTGAAALRITMGAGRGNGNGLFQSGTPVTPGATYVASGAFRGTGTGSGTASVGIEFWNADHTGVVGYTRSGTTVTENGRWCTSQVTLQAPPGAATATVLAYTNDGNWALGDTLDLDDFRFRTGSTALTADAC
ncbi:carbohydrate binding domain-containing protein [Curtobacterium sp. MCSS17_016]|uniref:carbohydrate binding domain-containing protein n=1 Tax=Curtobacterium sp. MCSS17_016 TaxID=2175644 RepID=UPI000DA7F420|nr:carbohydrate binding domain-containing protein [Curtobacterium sp. MCSS17_016]WIE80881.1 carbohydrate binding domain-containing protein [Curtobacterium sp. MCSS17_016]